MTEENQEFTVDAEVSFRVPRKRDSSSSEDNVNTSDELMEIDVNDQFIADHAGEGRKHQGDGTEHQISHSEKIIREAEASKARMFKMPGNEFEVNVHSLQRGEAQMGGQPATMIDENYMVVGAHIDKTTRQRIVNNEYIDFARLISRDRILRNDPGETRMEIVNRGVPPISSQPQTLGSQSVVLQNGNRHSIFFPMSTQKHILGSHLNSFSTTI